MGENPSAGVSNDCSVTYPQTFRLLLFLHKTIRTENENCAFLLMRVLGPAFVFHTEQLRKSNGRQVFLAHQRDLGGIPSHRSSYTGNGIKNSKVYSIICSPRDKTQVSHMLSQYLTTQVHAHSSSNPKYKLGELWQTLLNSNQGGPFLSPFSWRLFFRAWTLN